MHHDAACAVPSCRCCYSFPCKLCSVTCRARKLVETYRSHKGICSYPGDYRTRCAQACRGCSALKRVHRPQDPFFQVKRTQDREVSCPRLCISCRNVMGSLSEICGGSPWVGKGAMSLCCSSGFCRSFVLSGCDSECRDAFQISLPTSHTKHRL